MNTTDNYDYTYPRSDRRYPISWAEAVRLYLNDPHAKKMLRRFAIRFLPVATGIAFIDDFILPGIGFIDDISWPFLIGGMVVMLYKINRYRHHPPADSPASR